jgi:hypothetical protein
MSDIDRPINKEQVPPILPRDGSLRRANTRSDAVDRRHSLRENGGRMLWIAGYAGHRLVLERQYWSALATSPPRVVLIALQVRMSTEFLTKWTEPSPIATFKPPGCRLRAP